MFNANWYDSNEWSFCPLIQTRFITILWNVTAVISKDGKVWSNIKVLISLFLSFRWKLWTQNSNNQRKIPHLSMLFLKSKEVWNLIFDRAAGDWYLRRSSSNFSLSLVFYTEKRDKQSTLNWISLFSKA